MEVEASVGGDGVTFWRESTSNADCGMGGHTHCNM